MEIDEKLLKKINRQLRAIKLMLGFFFIMIIAMLAILGFLAYKVVTFTTQVNDKIETIQQSTTEKLDIKAQLCEGSSDSILAQQFCE